MGSINESVKGSCLCKYLWLFRIISCSIQTGAQAANKPDLFIIKFEDNMPEPEQLKVQFITITDDTAEQRLDNFLSRLFNNIPTSHLYRIVRKGELRVNSKRVKVNYRLQLHDSVRIPPLYDAANQNKPIIVPEHIKKQLTARIIYEDNQLLLINKPSGLAVHGGTGQNFGLIEILRAARPDLTFVELVHRLDHGTSGCLLIAKQRVVLNEIHRLLREHHVRKTYTALVAGQWPRKNKSIALPLKKIMHSSGEHYVVVDSDGGKESFTEIEVLEKFPAVEKLPMGATLLKVQPTTGRTHQIRVHTAHLGYPILGDEKYGIKTLNHEMKYLGLKRLFLHASAIEFESTLILHQNKFSIPLPDELSQVLNSIRPICY